MTVITILSRNVHMKNEVLNGLDNLPAIRDALRGRRAGLVTNPSAIDRL